MQGRHSLGHQSIFRWILTREAPENVPMGSDAEFFTPFQELNILQLGYALPHLRQHLSAQAFYTGLDLCNSGIPEKPDLVALKICLDLEEQIECDTGLGKFWQEI